LNFTSGRQKKRSGGGHGSRAPQKQQAASSVKKMWEERRKGKENKPGSREWGETELRHGPDGNQKKERVRRGRKRETAFWTPERGKRGINERASVEAGRGKKRSHNDQVTLDLPLRV